METSTLNAIIRAFECASKDPTRPALNHVLIATDPERRQIKVAATDGHMLSEVTCQDKTLPELLGDRGRFLVTRDSLPVLKLIAKDFKGLGYAEIPCKREGDSLLLSDLSGRQVTIKAEKTVAVYPDYAHIKPTYPDEAFSISFNPELLLSLAKALAEDKKKLGVTLKFKGRLDPILVTNHTDGAMGLLMPMRK